MESKIIFLILFWQISVLAQSNFIENSVNNLFNLSGAAFLSGKFASNEHPSFTADDSSALLNFGYNFENIYKEFNAGDLLFSVQQYGYSAQFASLFNLLGKNFRAAFSAGNQFFALKQKTGSGDFKINDFVISDYFFEGSLGTVFGKNKFGIAAAYGFADNKNGFSILEFPHNTTDARLNKYFYDLLLPTFGNNIDLSSEFEKYSVAGEYFFELNKLFGAGLKLSYSKDTEDYLFSYDNTTKKLEGRKHVLAPYSTEDYSTQFFTRLNFSEVQLRLLGGFSQSTSSLPITPLNPTKKGDIYLDMTDLGGISLNREGINFGFGMDYSFNQNIQCTLSNMTVFDKWDGDGAVFTPVLGFNFLPIGHSMSGNITAEFITNNFQLDFLHKLSNRFRYEINVGVLTTDIRAKINGNAQLEFGIKDYSLDEKNNYFGNIYKLCISPEINIYSNVYLVYSFSQYVPVFEQRGRGNIISDQKGEDKIKKEISGGTVHNVSLEINL
ncbi:MAG: hypothetical protein ABIG69_01160 [Bacteroidota bacterium]